MYQTGIILLLFGLGDSLAIFWDDFCDFRFSLLNVFGHCISVYDMGTIFATDSLYLEMTTPNSFSAMVTRHLELASP